MEPINWGILIALALFLAGFGAGAFLLAVIAELSGGKRYQTITKIGSIVAPGPVILAVLFLVFDLGKPLRFWEMILMKGPGFLNFNINSVMSIGVWLLTLFVILALLYVVNWPFAWGKKLKRWIGIVGLPFGLLVTVYTGVLLASTNNPLWDTALLPALFSVSAMSTGTAGVIFILAIAARKSGKLEQSISKVEKIDSIVIALEILIVVSFILTQAFAAPTKLIVGSFLGIIWWVMIIGLGLIVPLCFGIRGKSKKPIVSLVMSALVLVGGLFLRYVILIGGQV